MGADFKRALIVCAVICCARDARAGTYYVASGGSDGASGAKSTPWATILHAVQSTGPGDTVYLRAGTYNEDFEFRGDKGHGGKAGSYWTLKGYAGEKAVLTASLKIYMASYVRIEGLYFQSGAGAHLNKWTTGSYGRPHHVEIKGNTFSGPQLKYGYITMHGDNVSAIGNTITSTGGGDTLDHGIYVHYGDGKVITGNTISNVSGYGVHVYDERKSSSDPKTVIKNVVVSRNTITGSRLRAGIVISQGGDTEVDGVVVASNVVAGNASGGIVLSKKVKNVKIYNNTVNGGAKSPLSINSGVSSVEVKNCILVVSGGGNHLTNSGGSSVVVDNNLYRPGPAKLSGASDSHAINGDPKFVDQSKGDYHLQTGSAAIDVGLALSQVTTDRDGKPRPMDGDGDGKAAHDVGAFEYPGKIGPVPDGGGGGPDAQGSKDGGTVGDGGASGQEAGTGADGAVAGDGGSRPDDGCSCAATGAPDHGWFWLPLVLVALVIRRRPGGTRSR